MIGAQGDAQRARGEDQDERLRRQERELERQRREIEELKRVKGYDENRPGRPIYSNGSTQQDPDDPYYRDNRDDRLVDDTDDDFRQDL